MSWHRRKGLLCLTFCPFVIKEKSEIFDGRIDNQERHSKKYSYDHLKIILTTKAASATKIKLTLFESKPGNSSLINRMVVRSS